MDKDKKKVSQLRSDDPIFYNKFVKEWEEITTKFKVEIEKQKVKQINKNVHIEHVTNNGVVYK